ncbi:MAG: DegT/DnrJ/EryC1/StrS family aminotransferase, partial [Hyphomicrobiaceae bacterium]
ARTKAIIATHIYGNLADMDALLAIGARHGLPVIEDAAEAIGSRWGARHAGSRGVFGTFSFHGTKTMTTGEGGMFVTSDPNLYEMVLTLSNHGRARGQTKQFFADMVGFKYKMPNIAAAIGCAQMQRIGELVERKREIFKTYADAFSDLPVTMNPEPAGTTNGYWMPTIVCDAATGITREALQSAFHAADIDARVFFHPLSSLPMFEAKPANRHAYAIPARAINLPTYHDMGTSELERVIETVRNALSSGATASDSVPRANKARGE